MLSFWPGLDEAKPSMFSEASTWSQVSWTVESVESYSVGIAAGSFGVTHGPVSKNPTYLV